MHVILERDDGGVSLTPVTVAPDGSVEAVASSPVRRVHDLAEEVRRLERARPRWVWSETGAFYPELLEAGVSVERCVDLRLSRAILRASIRTAGSPLAAEAENAWDGPRGDAEGQVLFTLSAPTLQDSRREFESQQRAVASSDDARGLRLLLAAESAGALVAAEMRWAGLPFHADVHAGMLEETLGPRPSPGHRPRRMHELHDRIRQELGTPDLNVDSAPELLRALQHAGIRVDSTRSSELRKVEHAVVPPLLEYKRLARLLSANGWNWLETNVADGRFRPDFVPGGVVTGRWASRGGGGALQLPKQVRASVVADPGWKLVVADAAQLEPRILAGLSGDREMMAAGHGDLYAGMVASGAVATRDQAKVAMLGAMYGATSGESGRLLPALVRAYPRALALVEQAARAGERGEIVSTRLGRSSPRGSPADYDETASTLDQARRRSVARAQGRFTRNFVVQGTAAEWALCWMAAVRRRLRTMPPGAADLTGPHLVFFLHDELVVHTPAGSADAVVDALVDTAGEAGRLLFGALPVTFPVTVSVVDAYSQAT